MQRFYKFLIVCLLMLCVHFTKAQSGKNIFKDSLSSVIINRLAFYTPPMFSYGVHNDNTALLRLLPPIPANYYTQCFGIICKKELQLQKKTNLPLFFRLGSLEYVNRLEGKR
jgi:hypothetical protein